MPNRILREGINSSSRINQLSMGAEILYRRLMSVADDYGRYYASPVTVRGGCWPTHPTPPCEQDVSNWLTECAQGDRPLLAIYVVDGCRYLHIVDFNQKTRSKSKFPDPVTGLPASCGHVAGKMPALDVVRLSETETETKSDMATIPFPPSVPAWKNDETYAPFVEVWWRVAAVTGKPLIDEDFAEAHYRWKRLDFEQKLMAVKTTNDHLDLGVWIGATDPQFVPLPKKYLELEYKRPVVAPKGRDSPTRLHPPSTLDGLIAQMERGKP